MPQNGIIIPQCEIKAGTGRESGMITAQDIKRLGREFGADLVGIGDMDRYEGAPAQMDPRYILPEARSMIGLGFRIHRGLLRGIEEGTYFGGYPHMGYANINDVFAPMVLRRLANVIEDAGYEAVIFANNSVRFGALGRGRAVSPDRPRPDVFPHFRISGTICGMGEMGYSNLFLTPEFGPRQRLAFIMTDMPLEPDPILMTPICDKCMQCVKKCPGKAIPADDSRTFTICGRTFEVARLDDIRCSAVFQAGSPETSPFISHEVAEVIQDLIEHGREAKSAFTGGGQDAFWTRESDAAHRYWTKGTIHDYLNDKVDFIRNGTHSFHHPGTICGARGCMQACMMHLEEKGVLKNTFNSKFRRRPEWKLTAPPEGWEKELPPSII
jgi:epoxyqueuosine reductase